MRIFFSVFVVLFAMNAAKAEIIFSPAVSYLSSKVEEGGATIIDGSTIFVDARLGYLMPNGLYLGGIYAIENNDAASSYYGGASVGFVSGGFSLIGSYFLLGEYDPDGDLKYTGATGFQGDISYAHMIASNFAIGPQISYRSVEFDKRDNAGTETDSDRSDTQILPMINLWFVF